MPKTLFLIDGHSHCYQAYYAPTGQRLTAPDGRQVTTVYIFTSMLRKVLKEHAPDYIAAVFDERGPTFRHEMFPEYKANREAAPDELHEQVELIKEVIAAYGIPIHSKPGFEADDVLGTLAKRAEALGVDVVLLTADKDARQLLTDHVSMLNTRRGATTTPKDLAEKDGIAPGQVVDMMALSGDTSDNVPGVPGVGPKTALKLIKEYGTLDAVLAHVDEIKQNKLRENLKEFRDQALLSRDLVRIDCDVDVDFDLDACALAPDDNDLRAIFAELGFHSYLSELEPDLFSPATAAPEEDRDYTLVDTPEAFAAFLAELKKQTRFSFDLETTSTHPMRAKIVGLAFSWAPKTGWYLPVRAPEGEKTLDEQAVLDALRPLMQDAAVEKIGQNLKYDAICMLNAGCEVRGVAFDTMVAAYCIDPTRRRYGLDALAQDVLGVATVPISALIGRGKKQIRMDQVPVRQVCDYAAEDADIPVRLAELFTETLKEHDAWELFIKEEMPLVEVLTHMEYTGVGFDAQALEKMAQQLENRLSELEKEIHEEAGEAFNIASPKQLGAILFEKLRLPVVKRTKSGPSTNAAVLSELAIEHRLPQLVLEYRGLSKLLSTYVRVLPGEVLEATGRIHASFNQTATVTGRLSSSNPNLQNIPIRTELGSLIRSAFVPTQADAVMLAADYSQIELRILAHMSGDAALTQAFERGEDIHASVAAQVNGCALADVTPQQRRIAKAVNFGIVYGQTAYGLSRSISIPVDEADAFIKAYFEKYSGVKTFIDATIEKARAEGGVTSLRGHRRNLPDITADDRQRRQFAERAAVNTVIQGTAADMIKRAMITLHHEIRDRGLATRMVLQIHDELVFEAPNAELDDVREMVERVMVGAEKLSVPVVVDMGVGPNWLEAK